MKIIKPYGDRMDDGMMQVSFTLPCAASPEARQAALELAGKMGLEKAMVTHMEAIDAEFTFFIIYGKCAHAIDLDAIKVEKLENPLLNFDQINEAIKTVIGRKITVVGACIGSDAHTVGIDAIFNMKGFAHDWGFERYPWMQAVNLRAQVAPEELAKKVAELKADAVLVSRVVTQGDEHIPELKNFLETLKSTPEIPPHLVKICGGPRITHSDAVSWGYDAGFGPGTKPSEVGSFILSELAKKIGK
ncbi:MAG: OAM dimerization domain-containing protein [Deltaproteobacteria bacterium]|nr:OAM dimerization domain-containing protein [Deltaproteobacteria bacterium]